MRPGSRWTGRLPSGRRAGRAAAATLGAALAAGAIAPAAAGGVEIADGHVDYAARAAGGTLRSEIHHGSAWHAVGDVTLRVAASARTTVPAGPGHAFLGPAGSPVWLLPQTQRAGLPWLGWSAEALPGADGPLTWSLDAVDGPGTVALFQENAFGDATRRFDSADGLPDALPLAAGEHAHGAWSFTRPGTYRLTMTHRASVGGTPQADTRTLTVVVDGALPGPPGDAPPAASPPATVPAPGGSGARPVPRSRLAVRSGALRMDAGRRIAVRLRCVGPRACRGRLAVRSVGRVRHGHARRRLAVATGRYAVAAGTTRTVRLRATASVARTLRRRTGARLAVRAVATPSDGGPRTVRRLRLAVR
ncbi:choice-of-anchor M domain-containing protein [Patulibacter sp. SYSU D01012]|uniref:choice-of-anchor M domain-containing protein n=1 Tax=Patulibacter sp. SYSU D01012 TaxID=2817381 RepID=UPI001B30045E|nr:choice-of-anchor M domain-containing protein [Patulibacter sp. SYSU D01012]